MAADPLNRRALPAVLAEERVRAVPGTLAEVYETQVGYVVRCLRSLGLHGPALDDAVQDVFMVVNQKLAMFDGRAQLRTWLYAIVVRVARRYRSRFAQDRSRFTMRRRRSPVVPRPRSITGNARTRAARASPCSTTTSARSSSCRRSRDVRARDRTGESAYRSTRSTRGDARLGSHSRTSGAAEEARARSASWR